ncbi:MAG: DUF1275 family protein [Verrucomicrobia bacterium]|nr:DUF1275 family protein [Verrucomicrobiota bacterium]
MFDLPKEGTTSFVLSLAVVCTAAYVDAAGFLLYSGAYVSFMSGNTTRAGVFLASGFWDQPVCWRALFSCLFSVQRSAP